MTDETGQPPDARALHAALGVLGRCARVELALALGWDLQRLERARAHLTELLDGGALCLLTDGADLALMLAEDALDADSYRRLAALSDTRRALNAAEASRVIELIRRMLTEPRPGLLDAVREPTDEALAARGVLTLHPTPDASGLALPAAHPDVLFALGLCAAPTHDALPPRPAVPRVHAEASNGG